MNIIDSISEKERFWEWIILSTIIIIVLYVVATILIRLYCKRKRENSIEELSIEMAANIWAFQPEIEIQRILEVIISDTCIWGACLLNHYISGFLGEGSNFSSAILLVIIILAIFINNIIDSILNQEMVNQKTCEKEGETEETDENVIPNIRLVSSFSVLILFIGFSIYANTLAYLPEVLCMLGLVLGRFVYFDTTLSDLKSTFEGLKKYFIYMLLALALSVVILGIGISFDVIDTSVFLESVFGGHVFLLISINVAKKLVIDLNL